MKKRRKQLDKDTYQGTKDKFFNKNKNNKNGDENKTLGNIVKIGGAGGAGAAITNIVKQDQSQKINQKNVLVNTENGQWRVPASLLKAA